MLSFSEFLLEKAEYNAQEGESSVVHHASDQDFDQFRPLSHFGTANAARARAVSNSSNASQPKNLYTARIKLGKVAHIVDNGDNHSPESILHGLHMAGHVTAAHYDKYYDKMRSATSHADKTKIVLDVLKKRKINTIAYKNRVEDPGSRSYMITHPSQVRLIRKTKAPVNVKRGLSKLK
jgi:hypothetical protein